MFTRRKKQEPNPDGMQLSRPFDKLFVKVSDISSHDEPSGLPWLFELTELENGFRLEYYHMPDLYHSEPHEREMKKRLYEMTFTVSKSSPFVAYREYSSDCMLRPKEYTSNLLKPEERTDLALKKKLLEYEIGTIEDRAKNDEIFAISSRFVRRGVFIKLLDISSVYAQEYSSSIEKLKQVPIYPHL